MPDRPFSVPLSDHALVGMVVVLLVLMLLPFYPGWSVQESYLESSGDEPQMSFIHHQTFVDQTPLDVLIAGGSYAWNGLDPKVLEQAFSERYRRPFRAINIALNEGKDQTYLFVKNLTMRRKVRMVIINDFFSPISTPHENAFRRWLLTEHWNLMGQLPIKSSFGFYTESILGAPRHLLSLLRPNRPAHLPERQKFFESNGFNPLRGNFRNLTQFTDFNPELLPLPAEELFYRDD
ncbi:MAG: hypothetical protein G8345_02030, partial [Magnetococcales bacterium]|nr:hypothetical protein [Magnetococcales bacterium]